MSLRKDIKNINIEIHMDTWKVLKIISVEKNMTLQDVIREILDREVAKKGKLQNIQGDNKTG